MPNLPELSGSSTPKFLVTSEKISRVVVGVGGAALVVGLGIKALPYVISFAELGIEAGYKMAVLGAELALGAGIIAFVLNPKVQTAAWYMYMGWVDALALRVVKINPVARVKAYVSHYLEPMMARSQQLLDRAKGREKSAQRRVDETADALQKAEGRAKYCLQHGSPDAGKSWTNKELRTEFSVQSAKIRTMRDALTRLNKRLVFQQGCVKVLHNLQDVISAYTEVTRFIVDMLVQEYESAGEMAEGSHEVQGMLGKSEKTQFYNMAAAELMQQTDRWMAEVEGVMGAVQKQINTGHIDNAIGEEDLIRELTGRVGSMSAFAEGQRQLAQGGDAILLTSAKEKVLQTVPVNESSAGTHPDPSNRFKNLLPPR